MPTSQSELQKTFIIMIFAFVVSFLAQEIAEFLIVLTNNWQFISTHEVNESPIKLFPVALHMILALLMVAISWVSWSKSKAKGHQLDIEDIYSIKFITFILEVLLVTLYYSLAKSAEVDFSEYVKNKTITSYITTISAKPETLQMALIFSMFALWDFIGDVLMSPRYPPLRKKSAIFKSYFPGAFVYCLISFLCASACFLLLWLLPKEESILLTSLTDLALIALIFLFYKAKKLEYFLRKHFFLEKTRNNTNRDNPPTSGDYCIMVILLIIYFLPIILIGLPTCIQESLGL